MDDEKEKFRQIGIDLINEYRVRGGFKPIDWLVIDTPEISAFIRSIQLHEKTKKELANCKQEFDDYKQKVSDALEFWVNPAHPFSDVFAQFIITEPKPDPLVAAMDELDWCNTDLLARDLRAELDKLGLEIREKN